MSLSYSRKISIVGVTVFLMLSLFAFGGVEKTEAHVGFGNHIGQSSEYSLDCPAGMHTHRKSDVANFGLLGNATYECRSPSFDQKVIDDAGEKARLEGEIKRLERESATQQEQITEAVGQGYLRTTEDDRSGIVNNPLESQTFLELIKKIIDYLTYISGTVLVLIIVVAALMITVAGAKPSNVGTARSMITYGIIGFVIILSANVILSIVAGLF